MRQTILLLCSLAVALGWAPPSHPSPSKLPKAMEFAEKAWRFPRSEDTESHGTIALPAGGAENRRFPWSNTAEGDDEEDCEHTFSIESEAMLFVGHT